jgi:hypothetical protein
VLNDADFDGILEDITNAVDQAMTNNEALLFQDIPQFPAGDV